VKKRMKGKLPPLGDREEYIERHLFNELRWMLAAATEWSIQKEQLALEISGYHMDVFAMDSTFLHARALFEFFLNPTKGNYYGRTEFTSANLASDSYSNKVSGWSGPLHSHLMHAQDRSKGRKLETPDGAKDLNEMPVYFAREVLRLWEEFEDALLNSGDQQDRRLGSLARKKRNEAINSARCVTNSKVAERHAQEKGIQLKPVFG